MPTTTSDFNEERRPKSWLLFFLVVKEKKGGTHMYWRKKKPKDPDEEILAWIGSLMELDEGEFEAYKGETKKRALQLEEEKGLLLERLMKKERAKEEVEGIAREWASFRADVRAGTERWAEVQRMIDAAVKNHSGFFTSTTFYPVESLFDLNRLQQKKEDASLCQLEDPLAPSGETEHFVSLFEETIQAFQSLHREVESWLTSSGDQKERPLSFLLKKQALFSSLQRGDVKEAIKIFETLKSE